MRHAIRHQRLGSEVEHSVDVPRPQQRAHQRVVADVPNDIVDFRTSTSAETTVEDRNFGAFADELVDQATTAEPRPARHQTT